MSELLNFVQVIKAAEAAEGKGTKVIIREALSSATATTRRLIHYALNMYRVYGVRAYDAPKAYGTLEDPAPFFELLDQLATRELTGGRAQDAVTQTLELYPEEVSQLFQRVIDRDLRAGFSAETFNKVVTSLMEQEGGLVGAPWIIPIFQPMLAGVCEDQEEFEERIKFPCDAEIKFDGTRTICFVRKGQPVEYRARSGKSAFHLEGLMDEELLQLRELYGQDFMFDCESDARSYTEAMNAKKKGNDEAKKNLVLRAFFIMPIEHWDRQSTPITMRENKATLNRLFAVGNFKKLAVPGGREVVNYHDMVKLCAEVTTPGYDGRPNGQEGLILKQFDETYDWGRGFTWIKVKNFYDVDAKIVGWYPGRKNSRLEHTVGGIEVEGVDEKGREFRTRVGSGFSDELRADILTNWDTKYKNQTAVITYQEMSKAKNAEFFSLRFPTFNHLRDDKPL